MKRLEDKIYKYIKGLNPAEFSMFLVIVSYSIGIIACASFMAILLMSTP